MMYNPQLETFISVVEAGSFSKAADSNDVLLAVKSWESIHPLMKIIPVDWDYAIPFGLLYSQEPSAKVRRLVDTIQRVK